MEFTVFILGFVLVYVHQVDLASGLTLRHLNEKIDFLGARLDFENGQRHKDYDNIMSKLNEITTQLEQREHKPSIGDSNVDSIDETIAVEESAKRALNMNDQLQYLMKGMVEEKRVNGKARQKLPKIELKLEEMNLRMKRESRESRRYSEFITSSNEYFATLSHAIDDLVKRSNEQYNIMNHGIGLIVTTQIDKWSKMESEITGTNYHFETLSDTLKSAIERNDEQFENITSGIDVIVTSHNDKCEIIGNQLIDTINKQCNIDYIRPLTVTTTKSPSNTPDSTEKTHVSSTIITSCVDAYKNGDRRSGVYTVYTNGIKHEVYCDQESDGGGWTVFQRRLNGVIDFYRDWESYKVGFGDLTGEFWLGNDYMSSILGRGKHELRIDLEDFEGNRAYAKYSTFFIDPESNHYTIHVDGFSGDAGDALGWHNGMKFSAKDDQAPSRSCSELYKGGWWYKNCHHANLNGLYLITFEDGDHRGLVWRTWKGLFYSLKFVEMKFRSI